MFFFFFCFPTFFVKWIWGIFFFFFFMARVSEYDCFVLVWFVKFPSRWFSPHYCFHFVRLCTIWVDSVIFWAWNSCMYNGIFVLIQSTRFKLSYFAKIIDPLFFFLAKIKWVWQSWAWVYLLILLMKNGWETLFLMMVFTWSLLLHKELFFYFFCSSSAF